MAIGYRDTIQVPNLTLLIYTFIWTLVLEFGPSCRVLRSAVFFEQ